MVGQYFDAVIRFGSILPNRDVCAGSGNLVWTESDYGDGCSGRDPDSDLWTYGQISDFSLKDE